MTPEHVANLIADAVSVLAILAFVAVGAVLAIGAIGTSNWAGAVFLAALSGIFAFACVGGWHLRRREREGWL